jgi:hypothetical protein
MLITKLKETLRFYFHIKYAKVKKNQNILIYGISRGGSTMLAEALVILLNARLAWEPLFPYRKVFLEKFNPYSTHRLNALKLGWNPYVSKENTPKLDSYFESLFALRERNIRLYHFTNNNNFGSQENTIFKFCFGNFMYPYFNQKFGLKSILLLRHPFAIAASSLNFGKNYDWHKKNYASWEYSDTPLSDDFFSELNKKKYLINSAFSLLVYQTVMQFKYVLMHINTTNTIIVYYEDLVTEPEKVFESLEVFFDIKLEFDKFKSSLSNESFSSESGHTKSDPRDQLSKWRQKCTKEDIQQGLEIFESLEFSVYSDSILPVK